MSSQHLAYTHTFAHILPSWGCSIWHKKDILGSMECIFFSVHTEMHTIISSWVPKRVHKCQNAQNNLLPAMSKCESCTRALHEKAILSDSINANQQSQNRRNGDMHNIQSCLLAHRIVWQPYHNVDQNFERLVQNDETHMCIAHILVG